MKLSYSMRWLICWGLVIVGILSVVSGTFTLPANAQIGSGLILIGAGLGAPATWWLRYSHRGNRVARIRPATSVGAVAAAAGLLLLPWGDFTPVDDAEGAVEGRTDEGPTAISSARTTSALTPSPSSAVSSETPPPDDVTSKVKPALSEESSTSAKSEPTAPMETEPTNPADESLSSETTQRQPQLPIRSVPPQSVEPTLPLLPQSPPQIQPEPSLQTPVPSAPGQSTQMLMPSTSPIDTLVPQEPSATSTEVVPETDEVVRPEEKESDSRRNAPASPLIPPHIPLLW